MNFVSIVSGNSFQDAKSSRFKDKKKDKKQKTVTLKISRQSPKKTSIPSLKHHNSMATPMLRSMFQTEHIEYSI